MGNRTRQDGIQQQASLDRTESSCWSERQAATAITGCNDGHGWSASKRNGRTVAAVVTSEHSVHQVGHHRGTCGKVECAVRKHATDIRRHFDAASVPARGDGCHGSFCCRGHVGSDRIDTVHTSKAVDVVLRHHVVEDRGGRHEILNASSGDDDWVRRKFCDCGD